MSQNNFTLVVNLSDFFADHRQKARIFINENIKTVQDLHYKIANLFGIENFALTSGNEYLPPAEDVRIIRDDDLVSVISSNIPNNFNNPVHQDENNLSIKRDKKREITSVDSNIDNCVLGNTQENLPESQINGSDDTNVEYKKKKKRKKEKETKDNSFEYGDLKRPLESDILKNKNSNQEEEKSHKIKLVKNYNRENAACVSLTKKHHIPYQKGASNKKSDSNIDKSVNTSSNSLSTSKKLNQHIDIGVNIATSVPNSITYKKPVSVPTITDEYLKKKKTNIVKIDRVLTSTIKSSNNEENIERRLLTKPESSLEHGNVGAQKPILNTTYSSSSPYKDCNSVSSHVNLTKNIRPLSTTDHHEKKVEDKINIISIDCINIGKREEPNSEANAVPALHIQQEVTRPVPSYDVKDHIETNKAVTENGVESDTESSSKVVLSENPHKDLHLSLPSTKYFFLNTPSSKEKRENVKAAVKQKKENFFKLKDDFLLSPQALQNEKFQNESRKEELPELNMDTENDHERVIETKIDVEEMEYDKLNKEVAYDNNDEHKKQILEDNMVHEQIQLEQSVANTTLECKKTESVKVDAIETDLIDEEELIFNQQVRKLSVPVEEVRKHNFDAIETTADVLSSSMDIHNQQLEETKMCDISESKKAAVSYKTPFPVFRKSSLAVLQDSCYLNNISPCLSTLPEDSFVKNSSNWDISGCSFLDSRKSNNSGVGALLDSLRSRSCDKSGNQNSGCDTSGNLDGSEFVTKRKRQRKRKRKSRSQNRTIEETLSPQRNSVPTPLKPLKCIAAPKSHIRFNAENINSDGHNKLNNEEQIDASVIFVENEKSYEYPDTVSIYKWIKMTELPNIDDVVAFKIVKLTDQFSPEVSSDIIGTVKNVSESQHVTFLIWDGIEEFQMDCIETVSLEENDDTSPLKTILWTDVIMPRRGEKIIKDT